MLGSALQQCDLTIVPVSPPEPHPCSLRVPAEGMGLSPFPVPGAVPILSGIYGKQKSLPELHFSGLSPFPSSLRALQPFPNSIPIPCSLSSYHSRPGRAARGIWDEELRAGDLLPSGHGFALPALLPSVSQCHSGVTGNPQPRGTTKQLGTLPCSIFINCFPFFFKKVLV